MPKVLSVRELLKILKQHDPRFELKSHRGKGSEQILWHPDIKGRAQAYPLPCHGKGAEIKKGHYPKIKRRFNLPNNIFK